MDALQDDARIEDYQDSLTEAFIFSREQIYQTGRPFLDQAPQMYVPEGPIALTFTPDALNNPVNPLIISQKEKIALRVVARYPDGTTITLNPKHLHLLSSQPLVFDTNDPSQMEITSDQILILPGKNGLATFIAYPDPGYYPNILLTARLPLEVSIPGNTPAGVDKAVIVAGYRTNQGIPDYLWDATNTIANHAYKSLRKKGYSREDIFYLNPHFFQDIEVVYEYEKGTGYKRIKETEELEVGKGYWILINEGKIYTMTGQPVSSYTLSLNIDGWEMIGGCISAAHALADSCHIHVIYGYVQELGYERVPKSEGLEPGKGYWILINDIAGQCELRVEAN